MTMTHEALTIIELDAALAPAPMLDHYIEVVRSGNADALPDVAAHGRDLLLKLEHLVRRQRVEPITSPESQAYLAPWIELAEPVRVAA